MSMPEVSNTIVIGKALIIWDNKSQNIKKGAIDTDQITPSADCISISLDNIDEPWKAGAFRYLLPEFRKKVHAGYNFLIVGESFGIGSSREMSPAALQGIALEVDLELVIICGSYLGDIFRKNSINLGLRVLEIPDAVSDANDNDEFEYDKATGLLKNVSQDIVYHSKLLTPPEKAILLAGGIINIGKNYINTCIQDDANYEIVYPNSLQAESMTLTEQIVWAHRVDKNEKVQPGKTMRIFVDLLPASDGTAPFAIHTFLKITEGIKQAKPHNVAIINDHFVFTNNKLHLQQAKISEQFAERYQINPPFYAKAGSGIFHFYLPEKGLIKIGGFYAGADSHSRTYGAYGAVGIGIGSSMLGFAWATRWVYFTIPHQVRIKFVGKLPPWVTGKDIVLSLLRHFKMTLHNKSVEFEDQKKQISMSYRHTICNMMAEAEATNAIFSTDDLTLDWFLKNGYDTSKYPLLKSGSKAQFEKDESFDLSKLTLQVAKPYHPSNVVDIAVLEEERITFNKAMIGSCTNGSYCDLFNAALIVFLANQLGFIHIPANISFYVYPGSELVKKQILSEEEVLNNQSVLQILTNIGAVISDSWCGPCFGQGEHSLTDGEVAVTTFNRNWQNRMGVGGIGYLASPVVVAASAMVGYICSPERLGVSWMQAKKYLR